MPLGYYVLSPTTTPWDSTPRSDVRRVIVQGDVTEIGDDAFRDWSNLVEIVFEPGSKLKRIGNHAFAGTALQSFVAPNSLKSIGEGAFAGCSNLKKIKVGEGCKVKLEHCLVDVET